MKRRAIGLLTAGAFLAVLSGLATGGCSRGMMVREDATFHETRGDGLYEKGDLEAALKEYNRALEMGSQKLKIYNNTGNIHFRRGQYELAEKFYRMALEIDPAYLFALNNLAVTRYRQRAFDESTALLREAIKRLPGSALLYNSLAQILLREGDIAGARTHLMKAVELNPSDPLALNNLADLYVKHPELGEDPLPLVSRAIQMDPENHLLYDTLGWYYCQAGIFDEAFLALGKAAVQHPENPEVRVHFATVLEWMGKNKEALEQWKAVLELPGDREVINEARRRYGELKGR